MPGHVAPFIRFPDGAMIPLMIAQALQTLFRFREVTNPKRPLRNTLDNELLREFLRSGDLVATTFYDPVRFNEYGQNVGRDAATMQVRGGVARMVRPVVFQADVDAFHYPAPSFADCPEDAHERKYEDTDCLLCAASTCNTSTIWQRFAGGFVVSVISGLAGVALLAALVRLGYRHHQHYLKAIKAKQEQHENNIKRLQSAVEKVATLEFYVCFVLFDDLKAHGKLLSHEVVRDQNQLTILDTFADVKTFIDANQVAFISHQVASHLRLRPPPSPVPSPLPSSKAPTSQPYPYSHHRSGWREAAPIPRACTSRGSSTPSMRYTLVFGWRMTQKPRHHSMCGSTTFPYLRPRRRCSRFPSARSRCTLVCLTTSWLWRRPRHTWISSALATRKPTCDAAGTSVCLA